MRQKIDISLIKDILLEQWNEGELTFGEALAVYESTIGKSLDNNSKESFLKMMSDWNEFGLQEFVQIEKKIFEKRRSQFSNSEQYVEQFINQHFQNN